jgi:hypothetical protein
MDCPVCYETITTDTGQVTTSCGHTFHFKCLNTWYYYQSNKDEGQESCPCCRKEPGEFERASIVTGTEEDSESELDSNSESDVNMNEDLSWIRVGPGRWIIPSSDGDRLRILAEVTANQSKEDPYQIPPYDGEAHALWILRHLFEEEQTPAEPLEPVHILDKPKMVRRRRRSFGRLFWSHLGTDYKLQGIDGYTTD